jgi:hypothetical protein
VVSIVIVSSFGTPLAACHEFDVSTPGPLGVYVYAIPPDGSRVSYSDDVMPAEQYAGGPVHVRGWWPYSRVRFAAPQTDPYDLSPFAGTDIVQLGVCEPYWTGDDAEGPELSSFAFAHRNDDAYGTIKGNTGCYGADLEYRFRTEVTGELGPRRAYLGAHARDTGAPYFGACRIVDPSNPSFFFGIPKIPDAGKWCVDLTEPYGATGFYRPEETTNTMIEIANAGAATLPVNLVLSRSRITAVPPWEPET